MTTLTSSANVAGILPGDYGDLIVAPVQREALAFNTAVSTTQNTSAHQFHMPIVTDDGGAAWVAEGEEIAADDTTFDELIVTPTKVAGLRIISSELAKDSNPAAQETVGNALGRAIAVQVDKAFFGDLPAPAPKGLSSLTGVQTISVAGGLVNLDPLAEAISLLEVVGATPTAFIAHPTDALTLARIKAADKSNAPLLGVDATNGTSRQVLGVPLIVSSHVEEGTIWALDSSKNTTVLREDVDLTVSTDAYFSSDRVGVRGTLRVGFGFPQERAIVKITITA